MCCSKSLLSCPTLQPYGPAGQAPLSVGFSRQEYWSGLPCPSLGDLPNPEIKPMSLTSLALAGKFFTTVPPGKLLSFYISLSMYCCDLMNYKRYRGLKKNNSEISKDMSLNLKISLPMFSGDCEQLNHGDMVESIIHRWLHSLGHLFS